MTRYAFIRDDLPDLVPRIMVVIAQQDGEPGTDGYVIDANICADKAELDAYLNEWLGTDRPVLPVYQRTTQ